ncbi:MAG: T9SS type A sorting domain-containing protein [Bacteroidales bacterium]|nr:T9SS type A sorting domain-containing protein [Bacteroidales bacterium]
MVGTSIKSKSDSITHIMEIDFENSTIISSVVIPGGISTNINNAKSLYKDIKIYPNPADEILFIKLPQFEPINVEIYTITGQKVLTKLINSPSKSYLYVNNLQQGIYFIKINTKHYSTIKKFNK